MTSNDGGQKEDAIAFVVLGGIIIVTLVLFTGVGIDLPTPIPLPPNGPLPTATYLTKVTISEPPYTLHPSISGIRTELLGLASTENNSDSSAMKRLYIWAWEGKLRVTVQYPYGEIVVMEKNFKIEWWSDIVIDFKWQTKQPGRHVVTAEIYDKYGQIVDATREEVYR